MNKAAGNKPVLNQAVMHANAGVAGGEIGDVPPTEVAVGVLIRPDGAFLIAQRPAGKPMAGYWEFPGGKLEAGESVFDALKREFVEELGIVIHEAWPWMQRVFVYPHATVRLHFWRVYGWEGEPQSLEGQQTCWQAIEALNDPRSVGPWLPGALPLRRWLDLPAAYAISNAAEMGIQPFLHRLETCLANRSVRMLQLREPSLDRSSFARLFAEVRALTEAWGARLLVSSRHVEFSDRADGVHCTTADLMAATARPEAQWCGASCHDAAELAHAGALGFDFAVLGPVLATRSHPGAAVLGWPGFKSAIDATTIPVYALGGLEPSDASVALRHGAHGLALMRSIWQTSGFDNKFEKTAP